MKFKVGDLVKWRDNYGNIEDSFIYKIIRVDNDIVYVDHNSDWPYPEKCFILVEREKVKPLERLPSWF